MAARIIPDVASPLRRQPRKPSKRPGLTFVLNDPDPAIRTRDGLYPRVVWLPASVIEEHDREPGELTALLTLAVHEYLAGAGKGGVSR